MASFGRTPGHSPQQFVPGEDHTLQPIGNADSQVQEAMKIAKLANSKPDPGVEERMDRIAAMNVSTATDFLDGLSQYERELYLEAEKKGRARRGVLGRYGW